MVKGYNILITAKSMLLNPKIGSRAQVWYRKDIAETMPLHGRIGRIAVVSRGRPRNHGIEVNGVIFAVPCGNLRKPQKSSTAHPS